MSVYSPDNYSGRVSLAAKYITERRETTRAFDTCFEMYDGDAVAVALYRRWQKSPDGPLRDLWRYLGRESVEPLAHKVAHVRNLAQWARELRAKGEAEREAMWARMRAEQEARNAALRTELTPAGEQTVIPGCEVDAPQTGTTQLSLF